MNRGQVFVVAGSLSALLLFYCLSFGPIAYMCGKAEEHDLMPAWLDDAFSVVFYPHLRCMYHVEGYFDYIIWFVEHATARHHFSWKDFRDSLDNPDR